MACCCYVRDDDVTIYCLIVNYYTGKMLRVTVDMVRVTVGMMRVAVGMVRVAVGMLSLCP